MRIFASAAQVLPTVRQPVQLRPLDVPDRHPAFLRQLDHVGELLPVRVVPNQNHLKPPLIRPERRQNRLSAFKVFHPAPAGNADCTLPHNPAPSQEGVGPGLTSPAIPHYRSLPPRREKNCDMCSSSRPPTPHSGQVDLAPRQFNERDLRTLGTPTLTRRTKAGAHHVDSTVRSTRRFAPARAQRLVSRAS